MRYEGLPIFVVLLWLGVPLTSCFPVGAGLWPGTETRTGSQMEGMNNERLDALIRGLAPDTEGEPGYWSFEANGFQVVIMTDENADRMRIMTPIAEESTLPESEMKVLLGANFDRALDPRYALGRGYLWSVFLHPLSPLTEAQFIDGLEQVLALAQNYGTSYTSSGLVFQGGQN